MTQVTCRLTAKNRDRLQDPTLGNRVWATFTFLQMVQLMPLQWWQQQQQSHHPTNVVKAFTAEKYHITHTHNCVTALCPGLTLACISGGLVISCQKMQIGSNTEDSARQSRQLVLTHADYKSEDGAVKVVRR